MIRLNQSHVKSVFIVLVLGLGIKIGHAQDFSQSKPFWDRVSFGGGLDLGFGNQTFNIAVSPSALYHLNEKLAMGAGISFNYAKFQSSKLYAYGGTLMTFYNPIRPLQLSAEFEQLRVNQRYEYLGANFEDDYWSPALFLGVGYSTRNVTIGLKYNVLYDDVDSIYASPLIPFVRVYF
ncbi:alpha-ketoglutarate decarboxylase [Flavobacteriaceae bacterium F89]|uniref:Alpha-ketoglutarate decarboxylase n=1 Tax=Cerina litoralis TaxID=2874477 RepID=A0AAE3EUV9_9FLAO|nr:alpha-ketoglutarate decarboxylase [Cerina litoralis]MCG2461540.1 alpha-ketoglutarate decarboxylase [Cerina litoralis]